MIEILIDQKKVREAKEKLGEETFRVMMETLGVTEYDRQNQKSLCPFHEEKTPSFVWSSKTNQAHCFGACHRSYDILDVFMHTGLTYLEAVQKLFDLTHTTYSFGERKMHTRAQYRYPKEPPNGDKSKVYAYLRLRRISQRTADYLDIRQDERGNLAFLYYDANDTLTMVKYRPAHKVKKGENKNWCQPGADTLPLLYNMNRVNADAPLIICTGELDAASCIEAGCPNAVSIPLGDGNTHWIEECWEWLEQFREIILCHDNDESGRRYCKEVVPRLGSWRCRIASIPETYEDENGSRPIKDLNECLYWYGKEKVLEIIASAKESPVDSVVDYTRITSLDLDAIGGIRTGIRELDRRIMKLFYGTLNIVTGINGSGKSSFLSQVICQAAEQGQNVWYYSGELPNFMARSWVDSVFAGQRHLTEYTDNDETHWKVSAHARSAISAFYENRIYIYKDSLPHSVSSLMRSMEDTVRKYGAKLCVLDNLTSVNLECGEENKYERQARFVESLISFAVRFQVAVILVVHPHKMEMMRRMTKMDVQGISAIIDLAHRILSLYRVTKADKAGRPKQNGKGWVMPPVQWDVICDVLKDRLTGYEGGEAGMYYDRPSRRFFTSEADLDFRYAWDQSDHTSPLPYPPRQLTHSDESEVYGKIGG